MARALSIALTTCLLIAGIARGGQEPTTVPFANGWTRAIPVPMPALGEGHRYVAWVEGGWLQVRRETSKGIKDWHVVLARVTGSEPPEIEAKTDTVRFALTYRDGRYFVREDAGFLVCRRERKSGAEGTWPAVRFAPDRGRSRGSALGSPTLWSSVEEEGFVVMSSPHLAEGRYDCVVRLSPKSTPIGAGPAGRPGFGTQAWAGSPLKPFIWGRTWLADDGEMLVAERMLESTVPGPEVGESASALAAKSLDGTPMRLEDYRGKYVLLDFWATWCGPCLEEIPNLQKVFEEFGRDGRLEVMSVSLDEAPEAPRKLVESRGLKWLQLHAKGATTGLIARAYGAHAIPAIFLVGPDGRIVSKDLRDRKIMEAVTKALGKR